MASGEKRDVMHNGGQLQGLRNTSCIFVFHVRNETCIQITSLFGGVFKVSGEYFIFRCFVPSNLCASVRAQLR